MEKITVIPSEVRGLGNIVSPKTSIDFLGYNHKVTSNTDTDYGTVYNGSYHTGSHLTVTAPLAITSSTSSFTVTATLKNNSNTAITNATVYIEVNGVVTSATTNSNGVKAFTVTTDGSSVYDIRVYYPGSSNYAGCSRRWVVTILGSVNSVEVFSENSITQTNDCTVLAGRVLDSDGNPVRGVTVNFYKE